MTFLQIKYFVEVAKCKSFSKAAEKLYISHQALSLQMKSLENELGFPLFDRSNKRNLVLNPAGELLLREWERVLEINEEAVKKAQDLYFRKAGTIRVGMQNVTAIRDITLRYTNRHLLSENETIEFLVAPPETILDKLDNGEVDMCSLISFAILNRKDMKSIEIGTKRAKPVIAISKDHPLAKKEKLSLEDIKNETILYFEKEYAEDAEIRIRQDFKEAGIELTRVKKLKNIQEVKLAVYMNQGVALILDLVMEDLLDKVKLYEFKEMAPEEQAMISLVWKDEKWDSIMIEK